MQSSPKQQYPPLAHGFAVEQVWHCWLDLHNAVGQHAVSLVHWVPHWSPKQLNGQQSTLPESRHEPPPLQKSLGAKVWSLQV